MADESIGHPQLPPIYTPHIRAVVHRRVDSNLNHPEPHRETHRMPEHHLQTLLPKLRQAKPVSSSEIKAVAKTVSDRGLYSVSERGLARIGEITRLLDSEQQRRTTAFMKHTKPKMFQRDPPPHKIRELPTKHTRLVPIHKTVASVNPQPVYQMDTEESAPNQRQPEATRPVQLSRDVVEILRFVKGSRFYDANANSQRVATTVHATTSDFEAPYPLVPMQSMDFEAIALEQASDTLPELCNRERFTETGLPILPGWTIAVKLWQLQRDKPAFQYFYNTVHKLQIEIVTMWIVDSLIRFLSEYHVSYADLKCANIIQLAQRPNPYPLKYDDLIGCFQNIEEVLECVLRPGQRYRTEKGRELAAVAIWNAYRRYSKR
eukprot:jgi/Hompol1/3126/HPOL_003129-RA